MLAPQVLDAVDVARDAGQLGPEGMPLVLPAPPCPAVPRTLASDAPDEGEMRWSG